MLSKRFGEPDLDWRKIEDDLLGVIPKAVSMRKKWNLIAEYILTNPCWKLRIMEVRKGLCYKS